MTLSDAAKIRISRRTYIKKPLPEEKKLALEQIISDINAKSGLHIELMDDGEKCFSTINSYGFFSGVRNYFALAGAENDPEMRRKIGYYGEELVLTATAMGLGTCWVAGSYKKSESSFTPAEGESFVCAIAVGEVEKENLREKSLAKTIKTKRKTIAEMSEISGNAPEWFIKGVEAATLAPSARNKQPVKFIWNGQATATVSGDAGYNQIDLGIAEYHFELGSGKKIRNF